VLLTALFFVLLSFWGEMLWFDELDQVQRFWTVVLAQSGFAALGALVGGVGVLLLMLPIPVHASLARVWPALTGALSGALWGCWNWQIILKYFYQVATGIREPILQRDTGFYLFTLFFYDSVYRGLLWTTGIALATAVYFALDARILEKFPIEPSPFAKPSVSGGRITVRRFFLLPLAAITGVVAWGQYLNIFHLLYSKWGVVTGAGWTDVHVRLPAYLIVAAVTLLLGLSPLIPAVSAGLTRQFRRRRLCA
jgi:hypothetical protein